MIRPLIGYTEGPPHDSVDEDAEEYQDLLRSFIYDASELGVNFLVGPAAWSATRGLRTRISGQFAEALISAGLPGSLRDSPVELAAIYFALFKKREDAPARELSSIIGMLSPAPETAVERLAAVLRKLSQRPSVVRQIHLVLTTNQDLGIERALLQAALPFTRMVRDIRKKCLIVEAYRFPQENGFPKTDGVYTKGSGERSFPRPQSPDDARSLIEERDGREIWYASQPDPRLVAKEKMAGLVTSFEFEDRPLLVLYKFKGSVDVRSSCVISADDLYDCAGVEGEALVPRQITLVSWKTCQSCSAITRATWIYASFIARCSETCVESAINRQSTRSIHRRSKPETMRKCFETRWKIKCRTGFKARASAPPVRTWRCSLSDLLRTPMTPSPKTPGPFKGLDSYRTEDRLDFYGRDGDSERFAARILSSRFALLHARSGAGKTSLLQAKLAPDLETQGWTVVVVRPQRDPVRAVRYRVLKAIAPPPDAERRSIERACKLLSPETAPTDLTLTDLIAAYQRLLTARDGGNGAYDGILRELLSSISARPASEGIAAVEYYAQFTRLLGGGLKLGEYLSHVAALCDGPQVAGTSPPSESPSVRTVLASLETADQGLYQSLLSALNEPTETLALFFRRLFAVYGKWRPALRLVLVIDQFEELFTQFGQPEADEALPPGAGIALASCTPSGIGFSKSSASFTIPSSRDRFLRTSMPAPAPPTQAVSSRIAAGRKSPCRPVA